MLTPKKRFGQNFLIDPRKADRLVDTLDIEEHDNIIEIGPGKGVLTERILKQNPNLTAVELDKELIPFLRERFGRHDRFKLIENDIVKLSLADVGEGGFKIIGNLPYNISGAIIEWLINNVDFIQTAVITVQREVADRIAALPGTRQYGSLTVLVGMFYGIKRLFDIPPGCFSPAPKVRSSVLRLTPVRTPYEKSSYADFREFIYSCFSQKRKTLVNSLSLSAGLDKAVVEKNLVSMEKRTDIRAEYLSSTDFLELFERLRNE